MNLAVAGPSTTPQGTSTSQIPRKDPIPSSSPTTPNLQKTSKVNAIVRDTARKNDTPMPVQSSSPSRLVVGNSLKYLRKKQVARSLENHETHNRCKEKKPLPDDHNEAYVRRKRGRPSKLPKSGGHDFSFYDFKTTQTPSRSPSPPRNTVVLSKGRAVYTEEDLRYFINYIRWIYKEDQSITRREIIKGLSENVSSF